MRTALRRYLLDVHTLLRDEQRDRGEAPGVALELDLEFLAQARSLYVERRVKRGPYGGTYYSGLSPETDLFVYDGPQFFHIEAKDTSTSIARSVPTEFWARALDLHLARSYNTPAEWAKDHYPILVAAYDTNDSLRAACFRWGICLVEPCLVPLPLLVGSFEDVEECLRHALCTREDVNWACGPMNRRFPRGDNGIVLHPGRFRTDSTIDAILRFQRIASRAFRGSYIEMSLSA